jgi:hypothetical protein
MRSGSVGHVGYWMLAAVLIVLGFLGAFTIGVPFLLSGVAMVLAGASGRGREVLWPALAGVWAFVLGYVLVAPFGCTSTAATAGSGDLSRTSCTNVLGIDHSGAGFYQAPLLPAALFGLALAAIAAAGTYLLLRRVGSRTPSRPD